MAPPSDPRTRRRVLGLSGLVLAETFLAACLSSRDKESKRRTAADTKTKTKGPPAAENESGSSQQVSLQKLGQTYLSPNSSPSGGYSEVAVRADGRYAVIGTKWGTDGTYLVDLADPTAPKQIHYLPGSNSEPNLDVKFDYRNGLYHRASEQDWPGNFEIIDYGYSIGTPTAPAVIGAVSDGKSHNLTPHPTKPILYTVNYDLETNGFDVYDVADPAAPQKLGEHGLKGACHDISVDPVRKLLCCAYQGGPFVGFIIFDVSEPRAPVEVGRFDYETQKSYSQTQVGEEAFGNAHHGHFDPRRDLLVIGDERPYGIPGGKHVFDIGWKRGSLADPIPIGFTTSPNARSMEKDNYAERFDWTGHHFNIIPRGDATLLVSADWHEGVVVYDITDPTAPQPIDQYPTTDGSNAVIPNDTVAQLGTPPMAWTATYEAKRDFIVASDTFTGVYTFELKP